MGKKRPYKPRKRFYDAEKIAWIQEHINDDITLESLANMFSERFGRKVERNAFNKAVNLYCGRKQRPKTIHRPSVNEIGTIISDKTGKKCRVKTKSGYIQADTYFKNIYGISSEKRLIHLNGDFTDFSQDNIIPVSRGIHNAIMFRHWIFSDPERTKAAILCAELLILLGASKNENQFLKLNRR